MSEPSAPATPCIPPSGPCAWPYPRWIAHRGAGKLAPENTLAAFQCGASHGYRMFECDVRLSRDGVAFLLHDDTLERTTNGRGLAGERDWHELARLDAGRRHRTGAAPTPLPTLEAVARYCLRSGSLLNIEIKPAPGVEALTGAVVGRLASQLWPGTAPPPLLTSFSIEALHNAAEAAPELPRGLLLDRLRPDWLETALALGCVAVTCHHAHWRKTAVAQARSAGLRTVSYTVNSMARAQRLLDWGVDSLITDRVDLFRPQALAPDHTTKSAAKAS